MTNPVINSAKSSETKATAFFRAASCAAASWSVLSMGLHLWPFDGRHTLETIAPVNLGIMLWVSGAAAMAAFSHQARCVIVGRLPDVSIWAFLAIAAASIAFSPHIRQSASSLAKLALMYVGAFTLFGVACSREGGAGRLCTMALAAGCIATIASITSRLLGRQGFGFFANAYKYGTTVAILLTLGIVHLVTRQNRWAWLALPVTALATIATATLSGLCGIVAGLVAGMIHTRHRLARLRLAVCLLTLAAVLASSWQAPVLSHLREDVRIGETNGRDLRQRYIEWQAQLSLLGQRPVAGTGLGCVNDYRSMFYGRLPKLNTLAAFDRNGWLLIAAETGIYGLIAFVWLIAIAGRKAWPVARTSGLRAGLAAAAFAALVAACAANTFSSVHYNGVLNAFVLVLALAHHAAQRSSSRELDAQDNALSSIRAPAQPAGSRGVQ